MDAPPVIAPTVRRISWWWLGVLPLLAAVLILFLFNPSEYGFYPRCALYTTTGLYCPGCGALRATHQLLRGHVLTALHSNLLWVLAIPYCLYVGLRLLFCVMRQQAAPKFLFMQPRWIKAATVIVICFTILRNIPLAPFTWLAPR